MVSVRSLNIATRTCVLASSIAFLAGWTIARAPRIERLDRAQMAGITGGQVVLDCYEPSPPIGINRAACSFFNYQWFQCDTNDRDTICQRYFGPACTIACQQDLLDCGGTLYEFDSSSCTHIIAYLGDCNRFVQLALYAECLSSDPCP